MTPLVQRYRELLAVVEAEQNPVVRERRADDLDELLEEMGPDDRAQVDEVRHRELVDAAGDWVIGDVSPGWLARGNL